jgi:hypothetical protein
MNAPRSLAIHTCQANAETFTGPDSAAAHEGTANKETTGKSRRGQVAATRIAGAPA